MANFLKSLFVKGIEIDPAGATSAQVLSYNGTKFVPTTAGVGALGLDDLSDVVITTPATTQYVRYNGTNFVNAIISAGDVPTLNQTTTGSAAKWTTARTITLGGDLTGNVSIDGSANATLTATFRALVNADIPSLLTGKTYNGLAITSTTGTLTIANAKTLSVSNTLTFTGTDSSSVAFGAGGTVAYTNVTSLSSLATVGTITSGTWSGSFGAVSGANLTSLNASNLSSGTVASARISGSYTGITSVGTLTDLTIGGAGANRFITINAPTGYYAIQYFQIGGVYKWHYEVTPAGTRWSLVESGVAERIGVTSTGSTFSGTVTATTFSGSGASLTSLPAGNLTGTVANAQLPTAINISSTMQSYSYQGNANVAGTGNASYHPSGVYSTGSNWLYGTMFLNGNNIGDTSSTVTGAGQIYANGWFRSWGDSGWYNQSYGGGIYMVDTTFVRVYNSKIFYTAGGLWSVDTGTASTTGYQYLLRGTLYGNYAPFTSMREAKRNIKTIFNSGLLIDQLNPVTFQEKITDTDDEVSTAWKDADLEYGFIADEVAQVGTGHLAQYESMDDGTLKPVGWSFHGVVSVLVAEVKELRKRIAQLELTQ